MQENKKLKSVSYYLGIGLIVGCTLGPLVGMFVENMVVDFVVRLFTPSVCVLISWRIYRYKWELELEKIRTEEYLRVQKSAYKHIWKNN